MTPEELARSCAVVASEKKGTQLSILNIGKVSDVADFFVIASGTSTRQIKTIADAIEAFSKSISEFPRIEGYQQAQWIVIDLGDVVIHLFTEEYRQYYDLDTLWMDAPRITLPGKDVEKEALKEMTWIAKKRR